MTAAAANTAPALGFVLTQHWRDTPTGTEVELWLATDAGPRLLRLAPQPTVAFIPEAQRAQAEALLQSERDVELRPLGLRDFQQRPVLGLYCQHYRQLLHLDKLLRGAGVDVYEADIRPPERYLMERFITAPVLFAGTPDPSGNGLLLEAQIKPCSDYRPSLKLASLDIETNAFGELYSIAIEGCGQRNVYMLGRTPEQPPQVDFQLHYCASRGELLECLNQWMAAHDPDAIIGWNLVQFDLRLLHEHAKQLQVRLQRDGQTWQLAINDDGHTLPEVRLGWGGATKACSACTSVRSSTSRWPYRSEGGKAKAFSVDSRLKSSNTRTDDLPATFCTRIDLTSSEAPDILPSFGSLTPSISSVTNEPCLANKRNTGFCSTSNTTRVLSGDGQIRTLSILFAAITTKLQSVRQRPKQNIRKKFISDNQFQHRCATCRQCADVQLTSRSAGYFQLQVQIRHRQ